MADTDKAAARQARRDDNYKWVALANTTAAMFMSALDGSIVIIALPAIFRGIHLDPLSAGNISYLLWMIMGYRLVQAVLVVNSGRLGDMFGRVRMYNQGFVVFTVASVLLSFDPFEGTHGAMWLIGWRFVQAIGGSMLMANSAAILTDAFPPERRGFALGTNQISALAGMFIGLVLGGILVEWDWRAVFWINVPVGVFGTLWAYRRLRDNGERHKAKIDWWGNITFALGLGSVLVACTYGIQPYHGSSMGWESPVVLSELIGGIILLIVFVIIETRVAEPMFRIGAVQDPGVRLRQPGRAAGVDRARRHPVHADHLAAGHLAAGARLQLRADAAVGRHLHAADDRWLPCVRAGVGHLVRQVRVARDRHLRHGRLRAELRRADAAAGELPVLGVRGAGRPQWDRLGDVRLAELLLHHGQRPGARAGRGLGHARDLPEFRDRACPSAWSLR